MRFDSKALGLATAVTVGAVFTICSLFVALAPGALSSFISYALHVDITGLERRITWGSFFVGLVFTAVSVGVVVAAVAGMYHRIAPDGASSARSV